MHLAAIGGSDAGISAALRARELDPATDVTVVVADAYPNFSICGIPYYVSGEVGHRTNLAHRTYADLEATGMRLRVDTRVTAIDVSGCRIVVSNPDGSKGFIGHDELIVGTGAVPVTPPIEGLSVEMLPEVLPTVEVELGALVHDELTGHGVDVVDETMATGLPHVWAAGDCVATHHRLLGVTYLPLGTTAHKQGRVAGENALGGQARYAGSLGTQVVKVFDLVAARTGLRELEAVAAGFTPVSTTSTPDDHKAYYPGAQSITIRITGDAGTGRLLGAQLIGPRGTETAKRVDTYATALFHAMTVDGVTELDLSYTPPLGSPWDAVQMATQAWVREHRLGAERAAMSGADLS